ncbi:protein of unknown function [Methylorubrum extorquens]|uniref:RNA-binding S4 domain-containing protein n=1 Tax=Methylorubrum extorquens TaxID=408 RepID=A0A2N9AJN7_METEX|nr:protein of unknown function [Methylorubrum extorquens]
MSAGRQRLDKWLWFARFARTRSMAARLVSDGHVRVNGTRADAPAKAIHCGDVLTVAAPPTARCWCGCSISASAAVAPRRRSGSTNRSAKPAPDVSFGAIRPAGKPAA